MNAAYGTGWPFTSMPPTKPGQAVPQRDQVEDRLEEAAEHDEVVRAASGEGAAAHDRARVARVERAEEARADRRGRHGIRRERHLSSLRVTMRWVQRHPTRQISREVGDVDAR